MIIAPNRVRADQIVNIAVSVYRLYFNSLTIRAAIRREDNDFEYASVTEEFTIPSTKLLQMWVRCSLSVCVFLILCNLVSLCFVCRTFCPFSEYSEAVFFFGRGGGENIGCNTAKHFVCHFSDT